jgi:hypothetical protein
MEMLNEIERAEMLHKQLCTNPLWPGADEHPGELKSELLSVLSSLETYCTERALPADLMMEFQRLLADAKARMGPVQPTTAPSELWQGYALLKKFFSGEPIRTDAR